MPRRTPIVVSRDRGHQPSSLCSGRAVKGEPHPRRECIGGRSSLVNLAERNCAASDRRQPDRRSEFVAESPKQVVMALRTKTTRQAHSQNGLPLARQLPTAAGTAGKLEDVRAANEGGREYGEAGNRTHDGRAVGLNESNGKEGHRGGQRNIEFGERTQDAIRYRTRRARSSEIRQQQSPRRMSSSGYSVPIIRPYLARL